MGNASIPMSRGAPKRNPYDRFSAKTAATQHFLAKYAVLAHFPSCVTARVINH
jgi:hypothetical protein